MQWLAVCGVAQHQFQGELCVGWVVFGATGFKGHAIVRQQTRVYREKDDEVVFLQRIDDRTLAQFKRDGNRAAEPLLQTSRPRIDLVRLVRKPAEFSTPTTTWLNTKVVLGIRPVQTDMGGKYRACWRTHDAPHCGSNGKGDLRA